MRKIIIYIAIFLFFFFATFLAKRYFFETESFDHKAKEKNIPKTNFKVKDYLLDVGKISMKEKVKKEFVIYNLGPNKMFVLDVKPDCRCTSFSNSKSNEAIAANDSSVVTLEYTPKGPGIFQVSTTVELNSTEFPLLILRGEVIP